ncbi:hypothetical protein RB195_022098 [Necator americanus]|uniref:Uncharacterized protein n=1 Tax=Necator americanus TaxID=51031 RepID=A0ABR1EDY2_NECAM
MDEVDYAIHIEPLSEAIKELKEQLHVFVVNFDAIVNILNRQADDVNKKKWICYWKERNRSRVVSSALSKIARITTRLDDAADIRIPPHVQPATVQQMPSTSSRGKLWNLVHILRCYS